MSNIVNSSSEIPSLLYPLMKVSSAFFDDLLSSPAALLAPQPSGNNDAQGLQIGVARWGHITGHGPAFTVSAHLPSRARDCCLRAEFLAAGVAGWRIKQIAMDSEK